MLSIMNMYFRNEITGNFVSFQFAVILKLRYINYGMYYNCSHNINYNSYNYPLIRMKWYRRRVHWGSFNFEIFCTLMAGARHLRNRGNVDSNPILSNLNYIIFHSNVFLSLMIDKMNLYGAYVLISLH